MSSCLNLDTIRQLIITLRCALHTFAGPEEEQQAMKDANAASPPPPTSVKLGDFIPKPLE